MLKPSSQGANNLGENLIFLISQPRAGSTMLQRILGSHPAIYTLSEPWVLLHPIYALRKKGIWTEYNSHVAWDARKDFLHSLPGGDEDYYEGMRRMYGYLYEQILADSGRDYFLDKTPRYYHIIPQIQRIFPQARFIILLRNPLSVLCSILRTWIQGSWFILHRFRDDLLRAPRLLLAGGRILNESCTVVKYEDLVKSPEEQVRRLCIDLGLDFVPDMIEYGKFGKPAWRLGDKIGVHNHNEPEPTSAERWIQDIENPQVWRLAKEYLQALGRSTVYGMGYNYDDLFETLLQYRPSRIRLTFTWPLWLLLNGLNWTEYVQIAEYHTDRFITSLGRNGFRRTLGKVRYELKKHRSTQ